MAAYIGAQAVSAIAADPKNAKVGISITAGSSQSSSTTEENTLTQRSSNVVSGGDTSIKATGGGEASNLTIKGSEINVGGNVLLKADNNLNLQATQDISEQHSDRSSSSTAVGIAIEVGSGGASFGVTANAAGSRGNSDGKDVTNVLTHVKAGNKVDLTSKGDTNLIGAVVTGKQVTADVGKNLNIASVQDTSSFHSKDENIGGSVTMGAGFSGSVSAGSSKVDGNYASVGEQSGINAGDNGFQIKVNGNTDLQGGKIASTDKAVEQNKNSFTTNTLTSSDIENRSQYSAESISVSAGGGDWTGSGSGKPGGGFGAGSTSGNESSTTKSGITNIAGDTSVRSDKDSSNSLKKDWNGDELRDEVQAQAQITQAFGQQASKAIGDYAGAKQKALETAAKEAELNGDTAHANALKAEAANWADGGAYRVAAHAAAGLLGGGIAGALGAAASATIMPELGKQIDKMGLPDAVKSAVALAAAAGMGAVVGGTAGAASGFNVDLNNRQLHPSEVEWIKKNQQNAAKALSEKLGRPVSEQDAARYLTMAGEGDVDRTNQTANGNQLGLQTSEERMAYNAAKQYIAQNAKAVFVDQSGQQQKLFVAKGNDFNNASVYSEYRNDKAYRDFYWDTMGDNLKPDNPTAKELAIYNEREAIRLVNAAKQLATGAIPAVMAGAAGTLVKNSGKSPNTDVSAEKTNATSGKVVEEVDALDRIKNNTNGPDLTNKAPSSVLNQQAVKDLQNGKLPGTAIGQPGTPREMPASVNPSASAEDFASRLLGREPTEIERNVAARMNKGDCAGCWVASPDNGRTYITYRPAGKASDGTLPSTASVDVNYRGDKNVLNSGKELKLKFPKTGK